MAGGREIFNRIIKRIDWSLAGAVALLTVSGLVVVYSALLHFEHSGAYIGRQLASVGFGLAGLLLLLLFHYQIFRIYYRYVYAVSVILLVAVLFAGKTVRGAKSWLDLGYFTFQPYEVTKLLFIISMAGYLDSMSRELHRWHKLAVPVFMLMGNVGLIMLQPDFSSTLVYFPVFLVMLYAANVRLNHLAAMVLFGSITVTIPLAKTFFGSSPAYAGILKFFSGYINVLLVLAAAGVLLFAAWWILRRFFVFIPLYYIVFTFVLILAGTGSSYVVDRSMREYQKKRLIVFLNPDIDPLGSGYNINQSKIAVGSGRFAGKGLFNGTQGQLGFVPAQHTDFIFSLIGEETGFAGSGIVLLLYFLVIWRAAVIARDSRSRYGSLVAVGITAMFSFYAVINIGMVMGLMPITGLPLPFFSYGGSCMVSSLMAVGVLLSIHTRRFMY